MNESKGKTYFWFLLDLVLIAAAVLIIALVPAATRYGASLRPAKIVSVSAQGKTIAAPDVAISSFSVVTQGKNPEELADQNNAKMAAVVKFVESQGVEERDVKTTSYNLQPDYEYDKNIRRNFIIGYTLTQTVTVKMRDFGKIAPIIAGLTPLGVNQIGGINFDIDDPEKFLAAAREDAFARAQKKAAEMASQNGARLGKVLEISESPVYYPRFAAAYAESAPSPLGGAVSLPKIQPGSEEVTATVSLTYELK